MDNSKKKKCGKISARALEKKARAICKANSRRLPREYSKSVSVDGSAGLVGSIKEEDFQQVEHDDFTITEEDKLVTSLCKSLNIQDARLSKGSRPGKNKKRHKHLNPKICGTGDGLRWGKPTDSLDVEQNNGSVFDKADPNYASEEDAEEIVIRPIYGAIDDDKFEEMINENIKEYFINHDAHDFCDSVHEMVPTVKQRKRVVFYLLCLAMDRKTIDRELASRLLPYLMDNNVVPSALMEDSFLYILREDMEGLTEDNVHAPQLMANFIARAIADDVLPPKFLDQASTDGLHKSAVTALKLARTSWKNNGCSRLDMIWLSSIGLKPEYFDSMPTRKLSKCFRTLLLEYLDSSDKAEAERIITELSAPHYLHELIYIMINITFDRNYDRVGAQFIDLLNHMYQRGYCTENQINIGLRRIYNELPEISIDVPHAYFILQRFLDHGVKSGCIDPELAAQIPVRKRSRFISECASMTNKSKP